MSSELHLVCTTDDFVKAAERFSAAMPTAMACADALRQLGEAMARVPIDELFPARGPDHQEGA
jgi:hypothetical protein